MEAYRFRLLYSRIRILPPSNVERRIADITNRCHSKSTESIAHVQGTTHQTSAQPPSSSLYDASLSGLSGLSTSLATRSSARPKWGGIGREIPSTTFLPLQKGKGH